MSELYLLGKERTIVWMLRCLLEISEMKRAGIKTKWVIERELK